MPDSKGKSPADTADAWPVFVISLTDAGARRAEITRQLDALDIPFSFVDAIDGRNGLPADYEGMVDRPGTLAVMHRSMADAEYACTLSHMSVYRRIVEDGLPGAVILEDDAIVGGAFATFVEQRGYLHADLVRLDHMRARVWRKAKIVATIGQSKLVPIASAGWLATGYSINRKAAAHILRHAFPIRCPVDWPDCVESLRTVLAQPVIVGRPLQTVEQSHVEASRRLMVHERQKWRSRRFLRRAYWNRKVRSWLSRPAV